MTGQHLNRTRIGTAFEEMMAQPGVLKQVLRFQRLPNWLAKILPVEGLTWQIRTVVATGSPRWYPNMRIYFAPSGKSVGDSGVE
jgi:hypothetical protein